MILIVLIKSTLIINITCPFSLSTNEGNQVAKRTVQVEEKRRELLHLQQEVDDVKRKMRRLAPFVDYLNTVTKMEEYQTMFPNRLAIIHRVETLMIIRYYLDKKRRTLIPASL